MQIELSNAWYFFPSALGYSQVWRKIWHDLYHFLDYVNKKNLQAPFLHGQVVFDIFDNAQLFVSFSDMLVNISKKRYIVL